jgi:hypothetical protein
VCNVPSSLRASILTSTIGGLLAVSVAAAMLTPPAVAIADRYLTLSAILIAATILTIVVMSRQLLDRERRLIALVLLMTTAGVWYGGRLWVHEKEFDYLVHAQKADLQLTIVELAGDIGIFLRGRAAGAPPRPAAATWERDVEAVLRYEDATSVLYEQRFGPLVRRTREILVLEQLTDRDLDAFYRRPANAFQIDVIAKRLLVLGRRLDRT